MLEPVPFRPRAEHFLVHRGAPPNPDLDPDRWELRKYNPTGTNVFHEPWWKTPPEDPADGCPMSWVRSTYAASVLDYARKRTEGGQRVPNPKLDECEDRMIVEAVLYYEECEDRLHSHQSRCAREKMENDRKRRG